VAICGIWGFAPIPCLRSLSLFNVLVVLALHPSLLLLGHLHHPFLKFLIATFGMLHHVSGINYFISSSTSFWYHFLHFRFTYSFTHHSSSSDSPLCLSVTSSLFHSRLKNNLFHKSYPVVSILPPGDCLHGLLFAPFLLS